MSGVQEEVISSDEMRKRLYKTFKNRGVLDTLKTQLRNQLIQELKHPILPRGSLVRPLLPESESILVTASNSLFVDHLQRSGYEYTLSVFYPECGLDKDKVFSTRNLLQLLKISPRSALYKSLTSSIQSENQRGFLMTLLTELSDLHRERERCDADTQTSSTLPYRESLVEKMQVIDEEFEALKHKGERWGSLETRMAEYRKEAEARAEDEMNTKLRHFKDVELAKVKLEEQEKCRKEIQELRLELERAYQLKSDALINREKNAIDRLRKQQEIEEKEIYMQRQLVLKEIDAVRNREADLRQSTEAFEKACKMQQEKTRATEELLSRRELAVKTLEETYDQKLKNELTRYQLDLKEEYLQRTQKVTEDEKRNKEEKVRLQKEAVTIESKTEEHMRVCAELQRLQVSLDMAQSQVTLLTQQNQLLKERLEAVSDYPSLKRERVELQAQLRLLKKTLEEVQEENHHLRTDLSKPSKEHLVLQSELRRLQNARQLDEEEFQNQKQLLQVQLQSEAERCAQLKAQLVECEERTQRVTSHAEDVKMQLRQTQLALENEVLRQPKPSLVDRSVLDLNPDKLVPPDIYVDPAVLRTQDPFQLGRSPQWVRTASSDSDNELVAGAKARIRELEKEAESLEEAYRNYQQRALRAAVSSVIPAPRPFSPPRSGPLPQARVTFAQEPPVLFSGFGCSLPFQPQTPDRSSSPPRRLSSTPLSVAKRLIKHATAEDAQPSPITFRALSPERQLSPIPHSQSGATTSSSSLPGSPVLKSTTREPISLGEAKDVHSSSSSSPSPPEKITLDDLSEPFQGPAHLPELPQNQTNQPTEEPERGQSPTAKSLRGRSVTPPAVEGAPSVHQWGEETPQSPGATGTTPHREDEEEEEQWELERKRREEKRQQERQEAMEREQRELERLEHQTLMEEQQQEPEVMSEEQGEQMERERVEQTEQERVERTERERLEQTEREEVECGERQAERRSEEDPLQKYMRMVLEGKSSKKEDTEGSVEAEILSEEKGSSIAGFSQEEPDEDFW
ncbi:hypothetical protein GJAV_G00211510 [Gymnothorax javanicus]|nr:hypothetical protein GJAV_G00211510 [Gymnothorax javanicus]